MAKLKIYAMVRKRFEGIATKSSYSEIKKNLFNCGSIDLFPKEKIIRLNIRWGELYCSCTKEEWDDLYAILTANGVNIKKDNFFRKIFDVLNFFFIQPFELLGCVYKQTLAKSKEK